jgi:hypothetical protein
MMNRTAPYQPFLLQEPNFTVVGFFTAATLVPFVAFRASGIDPSASLSFLGLASPDG